MDEEVHVEVRMEDLVAWKYAIECAEWSYLRTPLLAVDINTNIDSREIDSVVLDLTTLVWSEGCARCSCDCAV